MISSYSQIALPRPKRLLVGGLMNAGFFCAGFLYAGLPDARLAL
jgi:hypothetical protein